MGTLIHLTDDVDHLAVAHNALEQVRDYAARSSRGPVVRDLCQRAIVQLCAWIDFTEDEVLDL